MFASCNGSITTLEWETTNQSTNSPVGVAADGQGNLYIIDRDHHRVLKVNVAALTVATVVGTDRKGFSGDGGSAIRPAIGVQISRGVGIAVDAGGDRLLAEHSHRLVRRVDAETGIIHTVVGTGQRGFSGDGGTAISTQLDSPTAVAGTPMSICLLQTVNHPTATTLL